MDWTTLCSSAGLLRFLVEMAVVIVVAVAIKRGVTSQTIAQYKSAAEAATSLATVNEATCDSLRNQIVELSKQVNTVHRDLGVLETENKFLRDANIELQKENRELRDVIASLQARLGLLENGAVKSKRGGKS